MWFGVVYHDINTSTKQKDKILIASYVILSPKSVLTKPVMFASPTIWSLTDCVMFAPQFDQMRNVRTSLPDAVAHNWANKGHICVMQLIYLLF